MVVIVVALMKSSSGLVVGAVVAFAAAGAAAFAFAAEVERLVVASALLSFLKIGHGSVRSFVAGPVQD